MFLLSVICCVNRDRLFEFKDFFRKPSISHSLDVILMSFCYWCQVKGFAVMNNSASHYLANVSRCCAVQWCAMALALRILHVLHLWLCCTVLSAIMSLNCAIFFALGCIYTWCIVCLYPVPLFCAVRCIYTCMHFFVGQMMHCSALYYACECHVLCSILRIALRQSQLWLFVFLCVNAKPNPLYLFLWVSLFSDWERLFPACIRCVIPWQKDAERAPEVSGVMLLCYSYDASTKAHIYLQCFVC
jgi:hypothetical protein